MKRRTFLKHAAIASATLLHAPSSPPWSSLRAPALHAAAAEQPNVLVIVVDELRTPQWFPPQAALDQALPNLARLRAGAVSFGQHFTAANACTPARSCLLTGLYSHQTHCLLTTANATLNPGFPTWGTLLRGLGYQTFWYGKWHLSNSCDLEPYGFSGGTCPSPNGGPGMGLFIDPQITDQFLDWFQEQGTTGPWCTTISLVNPHDIAWYPRLSDLVPGESNPPSVFKSLAPNYETPEQLIAANKPSLQRALQQAEAIAFGYMAFSGPDFTAAWLKLLDLYLQLQRYVDEQIGRVLDALEANSEVAKKTIILFTSDHGEFGGSHGLRGKGAAVYEEAIRVPLYVKDPTGQLTSETGVERTQLSSSVDITPLLLTLASGGSGWRAQPTYSHLASRLDLTTILRDPAADGRPYILHATDEDFIEGGSVTPYTQGAPSHVIGYRTPAAKLGTYSFWAPGSVDIQTQGQETECYDYGSENGRMELTNVAGAQNQLYTQLYAELVNDAIPNELRQPLPTSLQAAQQAALSDYLATQTANHDPRVLLPVMRT